MSDTGFTYRLDSGDLREQTIAKIRLEVGDNNEERGIKPEGTNYSDAELWHIYSEEGQIVGRAAAKICEMQAISWSSIPRTMFGSLFDPRHVGRNYMRLAKDLRRQHGYTSEGSSTFSAPMKRK
jgi:hypothetical protein